MRISTRPPISPARSFTARELVRSSGTSETCGSADSRAKPGGFFHGSAWPAQTRSAPAATTASTSAWPSCDLASVIKTLRNFGSQVISRSWRSSAMLAVSFSGIATKAACPARSRLARTRTRDGAGAQSPCRWATTTGPQSSFTMPSRHGMRSRKNSSWLWRSIVSDTVRPPHPGHANPADVTGRPGTPRAAGTAPSRNRGILAARSARARPPR